MFTNKAKCDGTKVVLEPSGIADIIEALNAKVMEQEAITAGCQGTHFGLGFRRE